MKKLEKVGEPIKLYRTNKIQYMVFESPDNKVRGCFTISAWKSIYPDAKFIISTEMLSTTKQKRGNKQ